MRTFLVAASVAVFGASAAQSLVVDFEDLGTGADLKILDGQEYTASHGLTFSSSDALRLVKVGGAVHGFYPGDTPIVTGALGDYFLATDLKGFTDLTINWTGSATSVSFDIIDIDGPEIFDVLVRDANGAVLAERQLLGKKDLDDVTGDQVITRVAFGGYSNAIRSIEIVGTATKARNIGIAFDNFEMNLLDTSGIGYQSESVAAVPLPAALPLMMIGLGGLGLVARRRRR